MVSPPRIRYTPRLDATTEGELAALALVYKFLLERNCLSEHDPKFDGLSTSHNRPQEERRVRKEPNNT